MSDIELFRGQACIYMVFFWGGGVQLPDAATLLLRMHLPMASSKLLLRRAWHRKLSRVTGTADT